MFCPTVISDLASFGAAGLMGAMWLWDAATAECAKSNSTTPTSAFMRDEQRLNKIIEVVQHNTEAMVRFTETQHSVRQALADLREEIHNGRKS